jgi:hypothetical protein
VADAKTASYPLEALSGAFPGQMVSALGRSSRSKQEIILPPVLRVGGSSSPKAGLIHRPQDDAVVRLWGYVNSGMGHGQTLVEGRKARGIAT